MAIYNNPDAGPARARRASGLRLAVGTGILLLLVGIVWILVNRRGGAGAGEVTLTPQEEQIRTAAREVYQDHIVSESLRRQSGDAILTVELRDHKLQKAEVNLSDLARKHEQGTSLLLIKAFMQRE